MTQATTENPLTTAGLTPEYVDESQVKIVDGEFFIRWKGKKRFVKVEREIGEYVVSMWCIGREEYERRRRCLENGDPRWW